MKQNPHAMRVIFNKITTFQIYDLLLFFASYNYIVIDEVGEFDQMNLMAGHQCPMIHQFNLKTCVDVKNGQLKAIKATLRLSRRRVHTSMFKVGLCFRSLTTTKSFIKEAPIYLGHQCPATRFKYQLRFQTSRKLPILDEPVEFEK